MTEPTPPLKWLRRSLATFVGLLAVTLVCGLLWGLLSSLGDSAGARAFRGATISFALLDGVSGIGLLIGTAWGVTHWMERSDTR
jgi:hypothetical protein